MCRITADGWMLSGVVGDPGPCALSFGPSFKCGAEDDELWTSWATPAVGSLGCHMPQCVDSIRVVAAKLAKKLAVPTCWRSAFVQCMRSCNVSWPLSWLTEVMVASAEALDGVRVHAVRNEHASRRKCGRTDRT